MSTAVPPVAASGGPLRNAAAETTGAACDTAAADELARVAHELQRKLAMFRY